MSIAAALVGATLAAPFTAAAGAYAQRRNDRHDLVVAVRALSWSLSTVSETLESGRANDWLPFVTAGERVEEDWGAHADDGDKATAVYNSDYSMADVKANDEWQPSPGDK